ncbi:TPA: hypothetical protein MIY89_15035 [Klebsiella pneumoniae]|nr:hypothetical protein [Klebsiella pneumoniae]
MICPPEILVMHTVILFRRQIKEAAAINFQDRRKTLIASSLRISIFITIHHLSSWGIDGKLRLFQADPANGAILVGDIWRFLPHQN